MAFITSIYNMQKRIAIIIWLGIFIPARAQNEKIWFFGNGGGIKFTKSASAAWTTATTSPLAQPAGTSPDMDAPAGCSVISQSNNDLALYSNGNRDLAYDPTSIVYGNLNTTNKDATQSVLIVPVPGFCSSQNPNCRRYIYFMTEPYNKVGPTWNGLTAYSVQMNNTYPAPNLSNSGPPLSLLGNNTRFSEKLAAVPDGIGGIWVVAHDYSTTLGGGNTFYKIHLTPTDIWPYAITSNIPLGSNFTTQSNLGDGSHSDNGTPLSPLPSNAQGQMKFSSDGTKLALALPASKQVDIFTFDKGTGALTFQKTLNFSNPPYGIEFSPNGNILYISQTGSAPILGGPPQYPYSIGQNIVTTIGPNLLDLNSTVNFITSSYNGNNYFGSLQLGPDKKIYIARNNETRLAIITNPNGIGSTCGYVVGSSTASTGAQIAGTCKLGLPTMVAGMIDDSIPAGSAANFRNAKSSAKKKNILSLFPNPVIRSELHLSLSVLAAEPIQVFISDISGKVVFSEMYDNTISEAIVNTKHFKNGIYFLKAIQGNQTMMSRIVVNAYEK
jgi:Secretion system C-terminal sorting domain